MSTFTRGNRLAILLLSTALIAFSFANAAEIELSVNVAPPPLPVYEQPEIPGPGWFWTPGYWAYGPYGWFWVPGTWVEAPEPGLVWTPGYWGWSDGLYVWNAGYWGPVVGFYGGINYGFGYPGHGYEGGYWQGNQFFYNRAVTNIGNANITNVYTRTVVNNVTVNNVSYNGGSGGITERPTSEEQAAALRPHRPPTAAQVQQRAAALARPEMRASVNHGIPQIAATARPAEFSGRGVVRATAGSAPSAPLREARAPEGNAEKPGLTQEEERQQQQSRVQAGQVLKGAAQERPRDASERGQAQAAPQPGRNAGGVEPPRQQPAEREPRALRSETPPLPQQSQPQREERRQPKENSKQNPKEAPKEDRKEGQAR